MSVICLRRGNRHFYAPPVGTTWLYESDGSWECPCPGLYQIELHGGGGGAGGAGGGSSGTPGGGGGGSGEVYERTIAFGVSYAITIGAGGTGGAQAESMLKVGEAGTAGGTTTCGDLSILGGNGGQPYSWAEGADPGDGSGSLATDGTGGKASTNPGAGGEGNINNTEQTYGDGGAAAKASAGADGQPGAVIITYLGEG